jgi:hypothetical protein
LKRVEERLDRISSTTDDDVYYALTLDPSLRDHRIIALLIDYTSKVDECPFYRVDIGIRRCTIAPDFTILWKDCKGRCFVSGIACPIISEHVSGTEESSHIELG